VLTTSLDVRPPLHLLRLDRKWRRAVVIWYDEQLVCAIKAAKPLIMKLSDFQQLIASHPKLSRGVHSITSAQFDKFEDDLGHALPPTLRWLLGHHGYCECCGVDNLEEAVARTLALRESMALPLRWLLLNDWGDAGIVLLDFLTERICWCGSHNAAKLASGQIDADADWFAGYPEWVASRIAASD
jgi:hypothetical protein